MSDGRIVIDTSINDDGISEGIRRIARRLNEIEARVSNISNRVNGSLRNGFNNLRLSNSFISSLVLAGTRISAMGVGLTGLIPIIASATTTALGLGASFAAAGVAAGAFGAVAVSALGEVFDKSKEVSELEDKIANAKTTKERIAAQNELNEALAGMTDHQKETMRQLNEFKSFWSGFVDIFEGSVFASFNYGLDALQKILVGLAPAIGATAEVVEDLMLQLNKTIDAGGFQEFFDWLEVNGAEAIRSFATIGGNLIQGFFDILQAFSPIGASIEEGLVDLSERFKEWSAGLAESTSFKNFVDYAKENGPILLETIGNIVDIFKNLITELAPLGAGVLTALKDFTGVIRDEWPTIKETVIGVSIAVGTFVGIMKGLQILSLINALMIAFRTGTLMATLAQWGLNAALLANPITWIVGLIALLVAAGVLLYRNWDTVKEKLGQLWSATKEKFNGIKESMTTAMEKAKSKLTTTFENIRSSASNSFSRCKEAIITPIENAKNKVLEIIEKIKNAFSNMKITIPKPKIPSVSVTAGSKQVGPVSIPYPKFDVTWHKTGGVFTRPVTMGNAGFGDVAEAIVPFSGQHGDRIAELIAKAQNRLGGGGSQRPIELVVNLDGEQVARVSYPHIDSMMVNDFRSKSFLRGGKG